MLSDKIYEFVQQIEHYESWVIYKDFTQEIQELKTKAQNLRILLDSKN